MQQPLFFELIEEKRLMRYLNTIAEADRESAVNLLNRYLYFSVLQRCLPAMPLESYQTVAQVLTTQDGSFPAWLAGQREEVRQLITETLDRCLLSLETHL